MTAPYQSRSNSFYQNPGTVQRQGRWGSQAFSTTPRSRPRQSRGNDGAGEGYLPGLPLGHYPVMQVLDDLSEPENDLQDENVGIQNSSTLTTPRPAQGIRPNVAMLQQQQHLLTTILEKQELFEQRQKDLENKVLDVQSQLASRTMTPSSSSTDSTPKRKIVISRALSTKVSKIHLASEAKFKPEESSCSQHNSVVKEVIIKEICRERDNTFSEDVVKMAVKRCYESCRRNFLQVQEGKEEFVEKQSKRRIYRSRRQQKFDKRASAVTRGEMKKWKTLSYIFMTEESDDPEDPNSFIAHSIPWRSQKLNDYIKVLDKRLEERQKKELCGAVSMKDRSIGSPSVLPQPSGPPWAVAGPPVLTDTTNTDHQFSSN